MNHGDVLWKALRDPLAAVEGNATSWDLLVRQAREARVLSRLAVYLDQQKQFEHIPPRVREHLIAARTIAEKHQRSLRWEIACVQKVLGDLDFPVVLLKGAAYLAAGLPPSRGRLYGDIDVMVPKDELARVERILLDHGWEPFTVHPYDQRYYRRWMHELPPLVHTARHTVLDLHHTILPETGRLHPDPTKLFAAAKPLEERPFFVLSPTDMVLHSAAHLFQDGDLGSGIRDLVDLDNLLRHFGSQPGFWDELVPRAWEMDLARPLFYTLEFTRRMMDTPIPPAVVAAASAFAPRWPIRRLMAALVVRALTPGVPGTKPVSRLAACWLLYVRSHWLRMPMGLLAAHLTRKALRRWSKDDDSSQPIEQPPLPDAEPY